MLLGSFNLTKDSFATSFPWAHLSSILKIFSTFNHIEPKYNPTFQTITKQGLNFNAWLHNVRIPIGFI